MRVDLFMKMLSAIMSSKGLGGIGFGSFPRPAPKISERRKIQNSISRTVFDILKEHGPLNVADAWQRLQGVGVRGLRSKRHMKIVLRWMRTSKKIRAIPGNNQFLYTTWFTKPKSKQPLQKSPQPPGDS